MLFVDTIVFVKDLRDGKFYKCKVVDMKDKKCKVHFVGWRKTFDEWLDVNSDRVKEDDTDNHSGEASVGSLERFLDEAVNLSLNLLTGHGNESGRPLTGDPASSESEKGSSPCSLCSRTVSAA